MLDYLHGNAYGFGSPQSFDQSTFMGRYNADAQVRAAQAAAGPQYQKLKDQRELRNNLLNWLSPKINQAWDERGTTGGALSSALGGGPAISAGPIWDPQQIQQRVNATRAQTDMGTASKMRQAAEQTAGRGFGAQSPLLMALQGNLQNQGMASNAQAENDIRWGAAQGNAGQVLKGQAFRENQYAARQGEEIERQKAAQSSMNALLQMLGGMAGGFG